MLKNIKLCTRQKTDNFALYQKMMALYYIKKY